MKNRFSMTTLSAVSAFALTIFASQARGEDEKFAFGHRLVPCASWYHDFTINPSTYTCSWTDMEITVPDIQDHRDLERVVQELQMQVQDLQRRLQALESRP